MPSFDARLRLPGHSRLPLGVEVDIDHERLTVTAGNRKVAAWPLKKLEVDNRPDGFHITVDGEEIVLSVTDSARFATELGLARNSRPAPSLGAFRSGDTAVSPAHRNPNESPEPNRADVSPRPVAETTPDGGQYDDIQNRISEVAEALASGSVSPGQAFGRWVRLLKELNRRHGQGSMPSDLYYQLNTQVLELIPEPKPTPPDHET